MKKITLLFFLLVGILQSNAQYYYQEQFFEDSFPSNLAQEHISGNLDFIVTTGGRQPRFPHSRNYTLIYYGDNEYNGAVSRLILPSMDISSASHPQLVFWHAQGIYYSNNDELKLYYRTSPGNDWILLREWTEPITSWQQEIINLPEQSNDYQISFVVKCNEGAGVMLDDIAVQNGNLCPTPNDLTANNIIGTQADLSWFSFDDLSTWDIEYGPTGFTQGEGTFVTANSNPFTLTGLTPLTTYDYYVRTNCGLASSPSLWVGPYTFRTDCGTIDSFPYQCGFENITSGTDGNWDESCWSSNVYHNYDDHTSYTWAVSDSNTSNVTGPDAAHGGTHFAYSGRMLDGESQLMSPIFDMSSLNQPQLRFYYHMYGNKIKALNVDTYDGTNWTTNVWTISGEQQLNNADDWRMGTVNIPNNTIQIRFRASDISESSYSSNSDVAIDDIIIEDSTCAVPNHLSATNITATEATLNWIENGTAGTWEIEYGARGFIPGQGTIINANIQPFTLTGLTPNTHYAYYVRSNCGSGNSYWAGPFDFMTHCNTINSFPYHYGFEDVTPNYTGNWAGSCWLGNPESVHADEGEGPIRWTVTDTATPNSYGPDYPHSGSNFVYTETGRYSLGIEPELLSPVFDMSGLNHPKLSFYYFLHQHVSSTATLYVDIFDGNQWTNDIWSLSGQQQDSGTDYWGLGEITIPNNTVQIRFRITTSFGSEIALDDIAIKDSSCFAPTNFTTTNITANTTELDWTENGTASSWQIEYGPFGFTPGQGTSLTTATKPYTLTGLSPNTEYQVYIKSDCSSDSSYWTNPIHFLTYCNTINTFPYTYGFEDVTANDVADWTESCWKGEPHNIDPNSTDYHVMFRWNVTDSSIPYSNSDPDAAHSGTHFAYTESYVSEGSVTELYSPIFDMSSLTYPQLSFYHCVPNSSVGTLYVDVYDGNNWTEIRTIERYHHVNSPPWFLEKILIPNNTIQIRIRAVKGRERYGNISIDDIRIEGISCPKPTDLTSTNPTTNSITLDWTENGTATSWQIEYGPKGFTQGQGTSITTSTKPYVLTGLNPHTQYEYYVKADCGGGNESEWSEAKDFSTSLEGDYCTNAIPLNVQTSFCQSNNFSTYSNIGAGDSGIPTPTCGTNAQPDVWFKITVPDSRNLTIKAEHGSGNPRIGWLNLSVYSGDCNNLNEIGCIEATSWSQTNYIRIDDLTAGETIYVRVYNKFGDFGNFNICASTDTCPLPDNLAANNITPTQTDISWTETGNATAWNVEYGPKGFTRGQGTTVQVNTNSYSLTGLTTSTGYDFYVQPDCGTTSWEGPKTFFTGCNIVNTFPYEYGFEDSTTSYYPFYSWGTSCWSEQSNNQTNFNWVSGLNNSRPSYVYNLAHSGSKFAYTHRYSRASAGAITNLISPEFDMSALTHPELSFYYHMFGLDNGYLSVDIYDGTQWVNDIWTVTGTQQTRDDDPYLLVQLPIPNNTTKIRFRTERGSLHNSISPICIDDVKIEDVTCMVPTHLSASNITTNQADLSWTENGSATAWDIEYGTAGFTQGQGTMINANNTTHNFTNLTPNAYYDVYVRANCGSGHTSHWVGPYTFHTLCDIVNTFPYQYGFEDVTPNTDDSWRESCWSAFPDYTLGFYYYNVIWEVNDENSQYLNVVAHGGSNYATPKKASETSGLYGNLYSPKFDMSNMSNPMLSFYYYMYKNAGTLYLDTFDGTTWTNNIWSMSGEQQTSLDEPWKYVKIQIPNNTRQIRFRNESDTYHQTYNIVGIDDILIEETPDCLFPSDLFSSNIADTHVKLNWTENGLATNWNIEYGPAGFTQGQGTTINVNTNHYTLSGLTPSTQYDFYVQSSCGSSTSTWSEPASFTTKPANDYCSNAIPLTISTNCTYETYSVLGATDSGVPPTSCQYSNPYKDVWFSVTVPSTGNLFIDAGKDEITEGYLAIYSGTCDNLTEIDCNRASYNDPTSIAKLDLDNLTPGDILYVRFESTSPPSDEIFKICVTTSCELPTNLSVNNITSSTAEISWTENGPASSWNVEYGSAGFTQGQGTIINVNSNPYTLTGLSSSTSYDYYVQSDCGGGDNSTWAGPYRFTTAYNLTSTSSYNYDFEDITPNSNGDWTGSSWTCVPAYSGTRLSGNYKWTPNSGTTPSNNTGPSSAYNGSIYAYTEASNCNPGDVTKLISPVFDMTSLSQPKLSFYYHMFGQDMGVLNVDTYDGTTWTLGVWSLQGQQQTSETDSWSLVSVNIPNTVTQIRFRAERGNGYRSDMAIDDINIQETSSSITELSNVLGIYPNPTSGQFIIKSHDLDNANIFIYTLTGKEIYKGKIDDDAYSIKLKNAVKGVYFVKIISGDKLYVSKLIVK